VPDVWYYAGHKGPIGPLAFSDLKGALALLPNVKDVLVWRDDFPNWKRAGDVPELKYSR
jgi:hypothetical protein